MPKIQARVLSSHIDENNRLIVHCQFNGKCPKDKTFFVAHWGKSRTGSQNALLWVFYNWLIEEGSLKEHGFYDSMALHLNMKSYFLAEKIYNKGELKSIEEGSTAALDKSAFSEYIENIKRFMFDFFQIDCEPFFETYKKDFAI